MDLDTGEVIADIRAHLEEKYKNSSDYSLDEFYKEYSLPLECLLFIARADGSVRKAEKELILAFCREHLSDKRVEEKDLLDILKNIEKMSIVKFRRVVTQVLELDNKIVEDILSTAGNLISVDNKIHAAEKEAFDYLQERYAKKTDAKTKTV